MLPLRNDAAAYPDPLGDFSRCGSAGRRASKPLDAGGVSTGASLPGDGTAARRLSWMGGGSYGAALRRRARPNREYAMARARRGGGEGPPRTRRMFGATRREGLMRRLAEKIAACLRARPVRRCAHGRSAIVRIRRAGGARRRDSRRAARTVGGVSGGDRGAAALRIMGADHIASDLAAGAGRDRMHEAMRDRMRDVAPRGSMMAAAMVAAAVMAAAVMMASVMAAMAARLGGDRRGRKGQTEEETRQAIHENSRTVDIYDISSRRRTTGAANAPR